MRGRDERSSSYWTHLSSLLQSKVASACCASVRPGPSERAAQSCCSNTKRPTCEALRQHIIQAYHAATDLCPLLTGEFARRSTRNNMEAFREEFVSSMSSGAEQWASVPMPTAPGPPRPVPAIVNGAFVDDQAFQSFDSTSEPSFSSIDFSFDGTTLSMLPQMAVDEAESFGLGGDGGQVTRTGGLVIRPASQAACEPASAFEYEQCGTARADACPSKYGHAAESQTYTAMLACGANSGKGHCPEPHDQCQNMAVTGIELPDTSVDRTNYAAAMRPKKRKMMAEGAGFPAAPRSAAGAVCISTSPRTSTVHATLRNECQHMPSRYQVGAQTGTRAPLSPDGIRARLQGIRHEIEKAASTSGPPLPAGKDENNAQQTMVRPSTFFIVSLSTLFSHNPLHVVLPGVICID